MKPFPTTLASAFALLALTAPLAHAATGNLSEQDTSFAKQAAAAGAAEVRFGKDATARAQAPAVKQFGQQMVADHTQSNRQLKQIARQSDIDLPDNMDSMHKKLEKRLKKMKGANFDQAYIQSQVQDHQTAIALYQQEAAQGQNPQLKAYAAQTLPILQQHYQMAQQIGQSAGAAAGGGSTGEQAGTAAGSAGSFSGATQAAPGAASGGATSSGAATGGAAPGGSQ